MNNIKLDYKAEIRWSSEARLLTVETSDRKFVGTFLRDPGVSTGHGVYLLTPEPSHDIDEVYACKDVRFSIGVSNRGELRILFCDSGGKQIGVVRGSTSEFFRTDEEVFGQWSSSVKER